MYIIYCDLIMYISYFHMGFIDLKLECKWTEKSEKFGLHASI